MKKLLSLIVVLCALIGVCTMTAFAQTTQASTDVDATEKGATTETTEFVLDIDVNERYTDIFDDTDGNETEETDEEKGTGKTVYIAILCAALVVSVVILAVSLKRVPKEEDIDISGQNKIRKDKEE